MIDDNNHRECMAMFGLSKEELGWAHQDNNGYSSSRPTNKFFEQMEFSYAYCFDHKKSMDSLGQEYEFKLNWCFNWIGNFVESEISDMSFFFISKTIIEQFEKDSLSEGLVKATNNLYKVIELTLTMLFEHLDRNTNNTFSEEELYQKYFTSYLEVSHFQLEEDHLLFKFKKEVLRKLSLRKDMFQEIVAFNKLSTKTKFSYKSFKLKMDEQFSKNSGKHKFENLKFTEIWNNADEARIFELLKNFTSKVSDFGFELIDGRYRYDSAQSHSGIKMAGFLVALSEGGWIKIFNAKSKSQIYDSKTLTRMINDFFGCDLAEKAEPFQKASLDNLRDKLSLFPKRVEPILKIIGKNSNY